MYRNTEDTQARRITFASSVAHIVFLASLSLALILSPRYASADYWHSLAGIIANRSPEGTAVVEFNEWRQLTETAGLTQEQVASICDRITGECNGSVGGVDLTGWVWASPEDVKDLFNFLYLRTIEWFEGIELDYSTQPLYLLVAGTEAADGLFPYIFDATFLYGSDPFAEDPFLVDGNQGIAGWTREENIGAYIDDDMYRGPGGRDVFLIDYFSPDFADSRKGPLGHWLYRPLPYSEPFLVNFEDVSLGTGLDTVDSQDMRFDGIQDHAPAPLLTVSEGIPLPEGYTPPSALPRDSQHLIFNLTTQIDGSPTLRITSADLAPFNLHKFKHGAIYEGALAPNSLDVIGTKSDGTIVTAEFSVYGGPELLYRAFLGYDFKDLVAVEFVAYRFHGTLQPVPEPRAFAIDDLQVTYYLDPTPQSPTAADDGPYSVNEGDSILSATSVLANDEDPNGDAITALLETPPNHASFFELRPDGTFDYTHDGSETTSDSFAYRASDGTNESQLAIALLEVTPVNDAPEIRLIGESTINLDGSTPYNDPGATAEDPEDGDITDSIVVAGDTVNASTEGTYILTYNVTDSDGLGALEVVRTVNVQIDDPPVITLIGPATLVLTVGDTYDEPGATAQDPEDGDLTERITIDNPVDTSRTGTYTVTYVVEDSGGNEALAERTVIIEAAPSPPQIDRGGGGGGGAVSPFEFLASMLMLLVIGRRQWISAYGR